MRHAILSLALLALVAAPVLADDSDFNKVVDLGQSAPAITGIPAVAVGEDGKVAETTLNLEEIKEEVVVLVFLANHCPVVVAYEDRLIDFVEDYKGKDIKVIGISCSLMEQDKLPGIRSYMTNNGSNYVYGYDASQDIGRAYGATNTPQFFVFDGERKIRYMGAMDDNMQETKASKTYLRDAVDALLAGETVEVKATRPVGCGIRYQR